MKATVSITTYNHEKYIAQAIDSALMQKTDFPFEILIGEDDSSDKTRQIVLTYKNKYPDRIRLSLNNRENVIYVNGKPTGRWNLVNNIKLAKGMYIALLDGDDYWTDQNKLKIQIDFLEKNPEFAMCFHNVNVIYENEKIVEHPFHMDRQNSLYTLKKPKKVSTIDDLIICNFIQTPSIVFRSRLFEEFPDWFYKQDRGDWPLHILNAQYGKIYYFDKIMACYRVHGGGVYSSSKFADKVEGTINVSIAVDKHFSYRYHEPIFKKNTSSFLTIIRIYFRERRYAKSFLYIINYIKIYKARGLKIVLKNLFHIAMKERHLLLQILTGK